MTRTGRDPALLGAAWVAGIAAAVASCSGNAALPAALAHDYRITWPVVVAVAAMPPVALGLVSHLFALRALPAEPVAEPAELPEVPPAADLAELPKADAIRL